MQSYIVERPDGYYGVVVGSGRIVSLAVRILPDGRVFEWCIEGADFIGAYLNYTGVGK